MIRSRPLENITWQIMKQTPINPENILIGVHTDEMLVDRCPLIQVKYHLYPLTIRCHERLWRTASLKEINSSFIYCLNVFIYVFILINGLLLCNLCACKICVPMPCTMYIPYLSYILLCCILNNYRYIRDVAF